MMSPLASMPETWSGFIAAAIPFLLFYDIFRRYCPPEVQQYLVKCAGRLSVLLNPNMEICIREYSSGSHLKAHEAYAIVEAYLSANCADSAKRLKAQIAKENENKLVFSMDENEETADVFNGVQVKWVSGKLAPPPRPPGSISYFSEPERRYYKLTCRKAYGKIIKEAYLQEHVLTIGREIIARNRQRKFFTHARGESHWSHIAFQHPATFQTLAMDEAMKQDIVEDLLAFAKGKETYERIGKAWKRGYLLHGPPGTGKSTMIAAMANLLDYDVYELDLTLVKDNAELRKLLMATKAKSVVVIEDIDCSLDLTGQRKKKKKKKKKEEEEEECESDEKEKEKEDEIMRSKVTLSGLLNSTDGLWSACVGEILMVFTTNHVDKLDAALTRRGRMDKRVEFFHCSYQGFQVLAKNYLQIEEHPLFEAVEELIQEVQITPADVAEDLMPKSAEDALEQSLRNLICTLLHLRNNKNKPADLQIAL